MKSQHEEPPFFSGALLDIGSSGASSWQSIFETKAGVSPSVSETNSKFIESFSESFIGSAEFKEFRELAQNLIGAMDDIIPQGGHLSLPVTLEHQHRFAQVDEMNEVLSDFGAGSRTFVKDVFSAFRNTGIQDNGLFDDFSGFCNWMIVITAIAHFHHPTSTTKGTLAVFFGFKLAQMFFANKEQIFEHVEIIRFLYGDNKQGAPVVVPHSEINVGVLSTILTLGITSITGLLPTSKALKTLFEITKIRKEQRDNLSFIIIGIAGNLKEFFTEVLPCKTLSDFFTVGEILLSETREFSDDITEFLARQNAGVAISSSSVNVKIAEFETRGRMMLRRLERQSDDYRRIVVLLDKLYSLKMSLRSGWHSLSGPRQEPVGVLFRGEPGIFKTVATHKLAEVILPYIVDEVLADDLDDPNAGLIYNMPSDRFFDGMSDKATIIRADDLFCSRDTASGVDTDAQKVIKIINSNPYCVPIANADSKNTKFFRGKIFMATTNLTNFANLESVTDPKAVERRFHLSVEVTLNPEYQTNGKVDKNKLPVSDIPFGEENVSGTYIPDDIWLFKVVSHKIGTDSEPVELDFKGLAAKIIELVKDQERTFYINTYRNRHGASDVHDELSKKFPKVTRKKKFVEPHSSCGSPHPSSHDFVWLEDLTESLTEQINYPDFPREFHHAMTLAKVNLPPSNWNAEYFGKLISILRMEQDFYDKVVDSGEEDVALFLGRVLSRAVSFNINLDTALIQFNQISNLEKIKRAIKGCASDLANFVGKWWKYILFSLAIGGTAYLLIKSCVDFFFGTTTMQQEVKEEPKEEVATLSSFKIHTVIPHSSVTPSIEVAKLPKLEAYDFGERNSTFDAMAKVFRSYIFTMYLAVGSSDQVEYTRVGTAQNVHGNIFMINLHFVLQIFKEHEKVSKDKGAQVVFITASGSIVYNLVIQDFARSLLYNKESQDKDVCFLRIYSAQRQSVGTLRYYIRDSEIPSMLAYGNIQAVMLGVHKKSPQSHTLLLKKEYVNAYSQGYIIVKENWTGDRGSYGLRDTYKYNGTSFGPGDCGSVLISLRNVHENRYIIGMHSAGDGEHGYATSITYDFLMRCLTDLSAYDEKTYLEDTTLSKYIKGVDVECQGGLTPIGKMFPLCNPIASTFSNLSKSVLYNKIKGYPESSKTAARLKPFEKDGVIIDPGQVALTHFGFHAPAVPEEWVKMATNSYENLICSAINSYPRVVLSLRESIEGLGHLKKIDGSTSGGFPHNLPLGDNKKRAFFAVHNAYLRGEIGIDMDDKAFLELEKDVEEYENSIKNGIRPAMFYTCNLKDEKRSKKKAEAGDSRMFLGSNFECLVLFRKYFGAFQNAYIGANIKVGSAIGINPYSRDWDNLTRELLGKSLSDDPGIGAGDYKNFDGHESPFILNSILDVINRWYGEEGGHAHLMRCRLWAEITNNRNIFRGFMYEWFTSMPSGNPLTSLINTMYNNIIFRIAWIVTGNKINFFNDNVFLCCLGDDNIFSVTPCFRKDFNELVLPGVMKKLGMVYTTELKETALVPFRLITEVEFLKRSFRFEKYDHRWVAPLRTESILESIYWTKKKNGMKITQGNLFVALREMSLHGKKEFDQFSSAISLSMQDAKLDFNSYNFEWEWVLAYTGVSNSDISYYF